jgi:hypothetical protein
LLLAEVGPMLLLLFEHATWIRVSTAIVKASL